MSRQLTLNKFYTFQRKPKFDMGDRSEKKPKLCLKKNSRKASNISDDSINVIDLISDDESSLTETIVNRSSIKINCDVLDSSSTSNATIPYEVGTPSYSTSSPKASRSSSSKKSFYSPTKKRCLSLRSPSKVKKNLIYELSPKKLTYETKQSCITDDAVFCEVSSGLDDKTTFLLTIIYKYLKDGSLNTLLKESSHDMLARFMLVAKPGLTLICRLYWRQEGWFKLEQIGNILEKYCFMNDASLHELLSSLIMGGFILAANYRGCTSEVSFEDYCKLLRHDDLKDVCKEFKIKISNKQDAIEALKHYGQQKLNITSYFSMKPSDNKARVLKTLGDKAGPCFKLSDEARNTLNELHLLMYLGIDTTLLREKKLELELINIKANRATFPYNENMVMDNASVVFTSREDFECYMTALSIYDEYHNLSATKLDDKCKIIKNVYQQYKSTPKDNMISYISLPSWLRRFTPVHLYVKVLEDGIQYLKKTKDNEYVSLALEILDTLIDQSAFRQHRKADWYTEKALILDRYVNPDKAAKVLLEGFNSDLPEEAKDFLRPRAKVLAKRQTNSISQELRSALEPHIERDAILEKEIKDKHIYKQHLEDHKNRGKRKFENRVPGERIVQEAEEYCISYYLAEGKYTHGGHWEGRIVTTIFFLLFWDVIYAKLRGLRGIMLSQLQQFPLDLFCDAFYQNRKVLIEERLNYIASSTMDVLLKDMNYVWESRPECEQSGIIRTIGWENISMVCMCLGPKSLMDICRRLALNYRYTHSGFPDLTLWNIETKQISFVEVKTDKDKPSIKQRQWMHYLKRHGIDTEFCYIGVNTTGCKARKRSQCLDETSE